MHSLETIKRLNQDAQDKFDGKEVKEVKVDIQKKTESRANFFNSPDRIKNQSEED